MIPVFMLINIHVYGIILTAFYFLFLSVEKRLFFLWIKIYNRIKQENNKIFDYLIFSIILIFECTIFFVKKKLALGSYQKWIYFLIQKTTIYWFFQDLQMTLRLFFSGWNSSLIPALFWQKTMIMKNNQRKKTKKILTIS